MRFAGVLRRRWLVVLVTVVLAVAGAFAAISLLRPRWRANATVVLHLAGPQVLDKVKGVSDDNEGRLFAYKEYYQTQREIIGSRVVAERALGVLGLAQDPVFLGDRPLEVEDAADAVVADVDAEGQQGAQRQAAHQRHGDQQGLRREHRLARSGRAVEDLDVLGDDPVGHVDLGVAARHQGVRLGGGGRLALELPVLALEAGQLERAVLLLSLIHISEPTRPY